MSYKNGEVIVNFDRPYAYSYYRQYVSKRPCFYVIQPTLGDELDFIKIGKSSNALLRLDDYSRYWNIKFKILYLVYFRDHSTSRQVHIENVNNHVFRDLKDKFEYDVKQMLKKNGVEPYYSNVSSEFYHKSDLKALIQSIEDVRTKNDLDKDNTKIVKNKNSARLSKQRYNLRSQS